MEFGISEPEKFWYKTQDGETHEVTVTQSEPPADR